MARTKKERIIDGIQWGLIIILLISCIVIANRNHAYRESYLTKQTYLKIYDSQALEDLRLRNKALEDSLKAMKDADKIESVVEFKYKYVYKTDTVYVTEKDTVMESDSVYHFTENSDTVNYDLRIKANDLDWYNLDFSVNDNFSIVNKEDNGKVETWINTTVGIVDDVNTWHRKDQTWRDRITIGPSVGIGYGLFNNNVDVYVGGSVSFKLW